MEIMGSLDTPSFSPTRSYRRAKGARRCLRRRRLRREMFSSKAKLDPVIARLFFSMETFAHRSMINHRKFHIELCVELASAVDSLASTVSQDHHYTVMPLIQPKKRQENYTNAIRRRLSPSLCILKLQEKCLLYVPVINF